MDLIHEDHPAWKNDGYLCFNGLNQYRARYVQQWMKKGPGEFDELELMFVKGLQDNISY